MLYALGDPFSLLVLLLSTVAALTLLGWTASRVAVRAGSTEPAAQGRTRPDPRRQLDPFGVIAAVLAGVGWAKPVALPVRASRGQLYRATLLGPAVVLAIGAAVLVALGAVAGRVSGAGTVVLQQGVPGSDFAARALLLAGLVFLFTGLLALLPLPPLPGGQLMLALAPRTPGWQKTELYLVEKNLGLVAVLVLLLLPLGGQQPPLLAVLTTVGEPLVSALTGLAG